MSTIRPFSAVRPAAGKESSIAALPYDVFNRQEAKEYVSTHPDSFLKIDRAETVFPDSQDMYSDVVYLKAKDLYEEAKRNGNYITDSKPCYYLYEQTMNGRSQTGLVCVASVDEYFTGVIKKHENTREDKELDRIRHVDTVSAQTGPIFLAFRDNKQLTSLYDKIKSQKPYCNFDNNNVTQKCWVIDNDEDIKFITESFSAIPNLYIADGHHRCASAAKVSKRRADQSKEAEYFLCVIFPDSELEIMDYNRLVKDLNGLSKEAILKYLDQYFSIERKEKNNNKPEEKGIIYMYFEDVEYKLIIKPEYIPDDVVESLDVSLLQNLVLGPLFGINDPKTDKRIDFVGGIRGIDELRRRLELDSKVAFAMHPTSINELFSVADAGLLMPPKSTWFEPKLLSGLFIHEI